MVVVMFVLHLVFHVVVDVAVAAAVIERCYSVYRMELYLVYGCD